MGGLVSIVSYSRPSLTIIASWTQFYVERPWGLLRDCTTSPINRFAALVTWPRYSSLIGPQRATYWPLIGPRWGGTGWRRWTSWPRRWRTCWRSRSRYRTRQDDNICWQMLISLWSGDAGLQQGQHPAQAAAPADAARVPVRGVLVRNKVEGNWELCILDTFGSNIYTLYRLDFSHIMEMKVVFTDSSTKYLLVTL